MTEKIIKRHSILTSGIKIEKLCERIRGKKELTLIKAQMKELNLNPPSPFQMELAKERLVTLIKEKFTKDNEGIPVLQNLRTLWMK